jgi:ADP-ribose pyrophosphatase YjhB (NUDIX family)
VKRQQRVAAYVVVRRADGVLLARWTGPRGPEWTLPGGGLDFGEDPADAAVREVREETGYTVGLDGLLFVNSFRRVLPDAPIDFHAIQIVYAGTVIAGDLSYEVDGSTDMAAWYPIADVPALARVQLVDMGLAALS